MSLNYDDRRTIEQFGEKIALAIRSTAQTPMYQAPMDFTPIADAIREGLGAIATAIEYNGELEDRRIRERNQ